jgi:hypothetical protein
MKIFLDDIRNAPDDSWTVVRTAQEALKLLKEGNVEVISLDHDLGSGKLTGYDVVKWIEKEVFLKKEYKSPAIQIHSANPVGRQNISAAIKRIKVTEFFDDK